MAQRASLGRDPNNSDTWLSLIEINLLSCNWDDAISNYGSSQTYIKGKENRLVRSWLGCLALALEGDPIGDEDLRPLHDQTIKINGFDDRIEITTFF
jgi:hypothetical protein